MLTIEPAIEWRHGGTMNDRGEAYCLDCRPEGIGRWVDARSLDGTCDACERDWRDCSPLMVEGTATIEHVKCKIF